jgi:hypothetical protein
MLNMGRFSFSFLGRYLLLWVLFFIICFGLGYPTLSRYEPTRASGLSDTGAYYQMVMGEKFLRARAEVFASRILVPYTARIFYRLSASHVRSWNPVAFSLLIANSLFCATTALLIVLAGRRVLPDPTTPLLGATLYLLSFAIPNLQLAGLIDSGEAFSLMAIVWTLLTGKWKLFPLWGILGALATVFVIVWWAVAEHRGSLRLRRLGWVAAMVFFSNLTMLVTRLALFRRIIWPWEIGSVMNSGTNPLMAFVHCFSEPSFWYVLGWLISLGIWRLKVFPRPWVMASVVTAAVALVFGTFSNMGGTVGRPIFNIMAPLFSLSVALLLAELTRSFTESEPASSST